MDQLLTVVLSNPILAVFSIVIIAISLVLFRRGKNNASKLEDDLVNELLQVKFENAKPSSIDKAQRSLFSKKYSTSVAHPKLFSKRHTSKILVQIYLQEKRPEIPKRLAVAFELTDRAQEHIADNEFNTDQTIKLKLSSPRITFSDPVILKLGNNKINDTNFIARPDDNCDTGTCQAILSITDNATQIECQSIPFTVEVTDFAFARVPRPFLSKALSFAMGAGSLAMFTLTLFGQIDTTFGLTSGTAAGIVASGIYARFLSLYQQPKTTNTP